MRKIYTLAKEGIKDAPQTIGIYQFLKGKEALYIGKAVNVKARLASHLQNARFDPKEAAVVEAADRIKIIPTDSEFKALLLEAQLIKKKKPKFNKIWRDDKSYLYIRITHEEYPKVLLARARDIPNTPKDLFFGPFSSTRATQDLIREVRKIVPFCTRKRISRGACFHSKIGLCDPCPNVVASIKSQVERGKLKRLYRTNIRRAVAILEGKTGPVRKEFEAQIKKLSKDKRFEEALVLRNRMLRLERLISQTLGAKEDLPKGDDASNALSSLYQLLKPYFPKLEKLERIEAYDASNLTGREATAAMVVLTEGAVDKSQYRKFKVRSEKLKIGDVQMLEEVIKRRFAHSWPKPDLIAVDGGKPQVLQTRKVVQENGLDIPVVGIAKAPDRLILGTRKPQTKELPLTHPGFNLLRLIRDESHRFSRKYHLLIRNKRILP